MLDLLDGPAASASFEGYGPRERRGLSCVMPGPEGLSSQGGQQFVVRFAPIGAEGA